MSTCNYESWSIIDLSKAIKDQQKRWKNNKSADVPARHCLELKSI